MFNRFNITIISRFPPPLGGVSVYAKRNYYQRISKGERVNRLDLSDKGFIFKYLFNPSLKYEVNSINLFVVLFMFLTFRIKKTTFVDHNASRHFEGWKKSILLYFLSKCSSVSIVGEHLREFYANYNVNVNLISPFIVPVESERSKILETYPDDLFDFISKGPFLLNSAWKYINYKNTDLYGFNESVKLLKENQSLRLVLAIGQYKPEILPSGFLHDVEVLQSQKRLFILSGQKELWPLFEYATAYLRLTPYDGDSVSVKEALNFNCTVIASDVPNRPKDCIIYDYDSFKDLKNKTAGLYK